MNKLTVGDGFRFGCGFMLAALVAWMAAAILGVIASLIMAALGMGLGSLIGDMDLSFVPQLIGFI
jgi:flagellar biosynthesis protein FliQ